MESKNQDYRTIGQKRCSKCGLVKPVNDFNLKNKDTGTRLSHCKACMLERQREVQLAAKIKRQEAKAAAKALEPEDKILCSSCNEWKFPSEFSPRKDSARGYKSSCKVCRIQDAAVYRGENREIIRERNRKYYAANPEACKARIRASIAAKPDKYKAIHSRWKKANKSAVNSYTCKRRTKLRESGSWTQAEWEAIKRAADFRCLMCLQREPEIELTADHIIPVSLGGPNIASNIQPLCLSCNSKKHQKVLDLRRQ